MAKLKPMVDDSYQRAVSLVNEFPKHWAACNGDFTAQRELIMLLVDSVLIHKKNIVMVIMKPDERIILPDFPEAPRALPPPSALQNEGHEGVRVRRYRPQPP